MAVVWIPSLLQNLTGGDRQATVPGSTLREVIDNLDARYPGIKLRLLDDNGRLQPDIAAAIDGEYGALRPDRAGPRDLRDPLHPCDQRRVTGAVDGGQ